MTRAQLLREAPISELVAWRALDQLRADERAAAEGVNSGDAS